MKDKVESIIDRYQQKKELLVSILQDIQGEFNYLPKETLALVSTILDVPLSDVYSVATFYKAFSLKPRGKHLINVCLGTACHVRGADNILEKIERCLGIKRSETTEDLKFTLETVRCMGCCATGPVVKIDDEYHGQMGTDKVEPMLAKF